MLRRHRRSAEHCFGGHDAVARLGQQGELRTRRGEDTEVGGFCSSYVRDHLRCTRRPSSLRSKGRRYEAGLRTRSYRWSTAGGKVPAGMRATRRGGHVFRHFVGNFFQLFIRASAFYWP